MNFICESDTFDDYLAENEEIDYSQPSIQEKAAELYNRSLTEMDFIKNIFEFVRDRISHSWDIGSSRVTCKASEVIYFQEGICYAKSNLLAALLRSKGIPAGFCYQRLTLGETPDSGYCIHALNAVYIKSIGRWVRLDARGNKNGVDAQFSVDIEKLAFPVREHYGEIDYPDIYAKPNATTIAVLKGNEDCKQMYLHGLPADLM